MYKTNIVNVSKALFVYFFCHDIIAEPHQCIVLINY